MMKAVVAGAYGSPDVLKLKDVEEPASKPDEVLIKVVTAFATTADTMLRTGRPYFARLFLEVPDPVNRFPEPGGGEMSPNGCPRQELWSTVYISILSCRTLICSSFAREAISPAFLEIGEPASGAG